MPLVLYYYEASLPVRFLDLVIHTLGINDEHQFIDLSKNQHMTPEYLKVNPLHTVPAIDDNGFTLWGSQSIAAYLADKYGQDDSLYPKDLQKRAIVNQKLFYSEDLFCLSKEILRPLLRDKMKPSLEMLRRVQDIQDNVEKLLKGHDYIAGVNLTIADFSFITTMEVFQVLCPSRNRHPLTKEWTKRCTNTMKDFEQINKKGSDTLMGYIKNVLTML